MDRIELLPDLRARVSAWHAAGERIALVPTMGNLHAGHMSLVRAACAAADRVVASVFLNPLQFGPGEDLAGYPRTLAEDERMLAENGCDLLFAPAVETMYPHGQEGHTRVEVPGLSDILCGKTRPGHFVGVATVVCKLMNMVQPDLAFFGEKDYQQVLVLRRMVGDLALPVEIRTVPIVREDDGLAKSSRNGYLTAEERARAPALHRILAEAADALRQQRPIDEVEQTAAQALETAGLRPDYVRVCVASDLRPAGPEDAELILMAAAYLGRARLIDNLQVTLSR